MPPHGSTRRHAHEQMGNQRPQIRLLQLRFTMEAIFRRDTAVVAVALLALTLLAWLALLAGAGTGMDPFAMSGWLWPLGGPVAQIWNLVSRLLADRLLWAIMIVAMMFLRLRRQCCFMGAWCARPSAKDRSRMLPTWSPPSPRVIPLRGIFSASSPSLLSGALAALNLAWIADLSLLVLAEKFLPRGERLSVALGVLVMIAGTGLVASAVAGQRE
jgi:hypothetical protein